MNFGYELVPLGKTAAADVCARCGKSESDPVHNQPYGVGAFHPFATAEQEAEDLAILRRQAEKVRDIERYKDAPAQVSMRPSEGIRRAPSTDQKKVRRQMQRQAADLTPLNDDEMSAYHEVFDVFQSLIPSGPRPGLFDEAVAQVNTNRGWAPGTMESIMDRVKARGADAVERYGWGDLDATGAKTASTDDIAALFAAAGGPDNFDKWAFYPEALDRGYSVEDVSAVTGIAPDVVQMRYTDLGKMGMKTADYATGAPGGHYELRRVLDVVRGQQQWGWEIVNTEVLDEDGEPSFVAGTIFDEQEALRETERWNAEPWKAPDHGQFHDPTMFGLIQGSARTARIGDNLIGRGFLGLPGSEIIEVKPSDDYVVVRREDGSTIEFPKSLKENPDHYTYERKVAKVAWKIDDVRDIVSSHSAREIDGVLVDMQTANAICAVYDALSPESQAKVSNVDIARMGQFAWKHVGSKTAYVQFNGQNADGQFVVNDTSSGEQHTFDTEAEARAFMRDQRSPEANDAIDAFLDGSWMHTSKTAEVDQNGISAATKEILHQLVVDGVIDSWRVTGPDEVTVDGNTYSEADAKQRFASLTHTAASQVASITANLFTARRTHDADEDLWAEAGDNYRFADDMMAPGAPMKYEVTYDSKDGFPITPQQFSDMSGAQFWADTKRNLGYSNVQIKSLSAAHTASSCNAQDGMGHLCEYEQGHSGAHHRDGYDWETPSYDEWNRNRGQHDPNEFDYGQDRYTKDGSRRTAALPLDTRDWGGYGDPVPAEVRALDGSDEGPYTWVLSTPGIPDMKSEFTFRSAYDAFAQATSETGGPDGGCMRGDSTLTIYNAAGEEARSLPLKGSQAFSAARHTADSTPRSYRISDAAGLYVITPYADQAVQVFNDHNVAAPGQVIWPVTVEQVLKANIGDSFFNGSSPLRLDVIESKAATGAQKVAEDRDEKDRQDHHDSVVDAEQSGEAVSGLPTVEDDPDNSTMFPWIGDKAAALDDDLDLWSMPVMAEVSDAPSWKPEDERGSGHDSYTDRAGRTYHWDARAGEYVEDKTAAHKDADPDIPCPNCSAKAHYSGDRWVCPTCGWVGNSKNAVQSTDDFVNDLLDGLTGDGAGSWPGAYDDGVEDGAGMAADGDPRPVHFAPDTPASYIRGFDYGYSHPELAVED